jgi:adenylate cyclase
MVRPDRGWWRASQLVALWLIGWVGYLAIVPPGDTAFLLRDRAFDLMLRGRSPVVSDDIVVVDIDAESLTHEGAWPWSRRQLAALVEAVADGTPAVIVVDIVVAGPDRFGQAGPDDPAALSKADRALAHALSRVPVVLSALMTDIPLVSPALPGAVILTSDPAPQLAPWRAKAAIWPFAPLMQPAVAVGIASLGSDADGLVRRVPVFLEVDGVAQAGLAVQAVKAAAGASSYILRGPVRGSTARLGIGGHDLPITPSADLRIPVSGPPDWADRTISALRIMNHGGAVVSLAGKIVLIGGSAPEMGGLRATAGHPLTPSVQIQADAIQAILTGMVPYRPRHAGTVEALAVAVLLAVGLALGQAFGPAIAAGLGVVIAGLWVTGTGLVFWWQNQLIDPVIPAGLLLGATAVSGLFAAMRTRRAGWRMRVRFEQHLPPSVVARIAAGFARMPREAREVTFLFTDLEGFTAATNRLGPTAMVGLLDEYFGGLTSIVVAAGGTVDKIVGDAMHAMFNAPDDLADHATRAIECALDIQRFTAEFRMRADVAAAAWGRTRIGIETGTVIVGDVGLGAKLDYTAHGDAINTAARLEALNNDLGTTICVGPICRALAHGIAFQFRGEVAIKGRGTLAVFEPCGRHDDDPQTEKRHGAV